MASDGYNQSWSRGTRQDLISGKVKVESSKSANIFLGQHPSESPVREQKPPRARLKPTFKGSVPGPGSHKPTQP